MAIKKSDLYITLWKNCDELHGGMDASQYKDYVLVILFIKYIKGIIGLPSNLFFGTGIPACILVLDKKDTKQHCANWTNRLKN